MTLAELEEVREFMGNAHYVLDAGASQLTVQAFAEGLAGIADHRPQFSVREFSAELEFDPDELEGGALRLVAKAGSLEIMDEVSQKDRKAIEGIISEVLNPQLYPKVVFRSSRVVCSRVDVSRYRAEVLGMVNLHGEENEQAIQAQLILTEGSLRAHGEFRLRQSDFGLTIASVAGGLLRIKDELKFMFFLVSRKQNGASQTPGINGEPSGKIFGSGSERSARGQSA
jgi:polyisoprenoid-binding protein YceI